MAVKVRPRQARAARSHAGGGRSGEQAPARAGSPLETSSWAAQTGPTPHSSSSSGASSRTSSAGSASTMSTSSARVSTRRLRRRRAGGRCSANAGGTDPTEGSDARGGQGHPAARPHSRIDGRQRRGPEGTQEEVGGTGPRGVWAAPPPRLRRASRGRAGSPCPRRRDPPPAASRRPSHARGRACSSPRSRRLRRR